MGPVGDNSWLWGGGGNCMTLCIMFHINFEKKVGAIWNISLPLC
jgi:hypothetical protein